MPKENQMTAKTIENKWPRRRLLMRSVISSTMPIGWTWVAVTALIPYFWMESGQGTSEIVLLGATRSTWMSLHVWSSFAMAILTIAHMLMNKKGVARSYRVVSGAPNKAATSTPAKRGFAWVGALALVAITIAGGYWFATVDGGHGTGNDHELAIDGTFQGRGFGGGGGGIDHVDTDH